MICLRTFLPAGCHLTFYGWVLLLDIICQLRIHIVGTSRFGIKAKTLIKLPKDVLYDRLLVLHREHPDAEILCFVLLAEFLARKPQKRQRDLITVFLMMLLCKRHRLVVEKAGICHLDRCFQTVFVRAFLLCLKNIETFREQRLAPDILRLSVPGYFLRILRHHLRTVDNIYNKLFHNR